MHMWPRILIPVAIGLLFPSNCLLGGQNKNRIDQSIRTTLTVDTVVAGWQEGDILSSLIHFGFINKLPLGIVIEGDSLCSKRIPASGESARLGSLIDEIAEQDAVYIAEISNQMLYIHPKMMKPSTHAALDVVIPSFASKATSAQQISIGLWMFMRAVLVPQESSAFAGGIQGGAEKLPAFEMTNASARSVVDRVVTSGQGGVWVMYEVPANWQADPKDKPFEILSYSGNPASSLNIRCSKSDH